MGERRRWIEDHFRSLHTSSRLHSLLTSLNTGGIAYYCTRSVSKPKTAFPVIQEHPKLVTTAARLSVRTGMLNQPQIEAVVAHLRHQESVSARRQQQKALWALRQKLLLLNNHFIVHHQSAADMITFSAATRTNTASLKLQHLDHGPVVQSDFPRRNIDLVTRTNVVGKKADPRSTVTADKETIKERETPKVMPVHSSAIMKPSSTTTKKPPSRKKTKLDAKWLATYETLKIYKEEYGNCMVPRGFAKDHRLGLWVAEQRKQYKLMKNDRPCSITQERVALLEQIDFAWDAQEAMWMKHLTDLKAYKAEYGDCFVQLNHPKYPKLGLWVKEQRRHYALLKQGKHSHMTQERAQALDDLCFCWDAQEVVWAERLRELCAYKAAHGNCRVSTHFPDNKKLGTWVHHQRRQYKKFKSGQKCHITQERISVLDSLGMVWSPREHPPSSTNERRRKRGVAAKQSPEPGPLSQNRDLKPSKRQRVDFKK